MTFSATMASMARRRGGEGRGGEGRGGEGRGGEGRGGEGREEGRDGGLCN